VPPTVEELAVAGGLRQEPVPVVACETVPLQVPASAEIVIEGWIPTDRKEMEGPFGEYAGYMGLAEPNYFMDISCITHRNNPIFHAFFSQMPPSEASLMVRLGREKPIKHHLKNVLGLPITDVCLRESGASAAWLIISMRKQFKEQPIQAIWGSWAFEPTLSKFTVVVDEDIDPHDDFMVDWAIAFRSQPDRDVVIQTRTAPVRLDPSVSGFGEEGYSKYNVWGSKLGIDATMKHKYPAKSLPPQEHLEEIDRRWHEYGF
jgi:UbiD family decarboxylase